MTGNALPPFRADHVGSLLRPEELKTARAAYEAEELDADGLRQVEDRLIREVVAKQESLGSRAVTDGEFRRSWWHFDFLAGLEGVELVRGDDPDPLPAIYRDMINHALAAKPDDMMITTHVCRGNFRSSWIAEGGYEPVAEILLGGTDYDGYFLEYDTDRAGGFEPLRFLPKGQKRVVLGLLTSKFGELEDREMIEKRIEEASQYADRDQFCLSPQCGFASTEEGNVLSHEEQWNKLRFIVETAEGVWA